LYNEKLGEGMVGMRGMRCAFLAGLINASATRVSEGEKEEERRLPFDDVEREVPLRSEVMLLKC